MIQKRDTHGRALEDDRLDDMGSDYYEELYDRGTRTGEGARIEYNQFAQYRGDGDARDRAARGARNHVW